MIIHDFNLGVVKFKEAEKRNAEFAAGGRVNTYKWKLDRWRRVDDVIQSPYFNATKESRIYETYWDLRDWLKKEAECLWVTGINVY